MRDARSRIYRAVLGEDGLPVSASRYSRRRALASFAGLLAASPCLQAQGVRRSIGEPPGRITPLDEFANVPEFQEMARRKLNAETFARIAGGDRQALDRITFRPRMMVNTYGLDLTLELFGQSMFAPILVGPASRQDRFHRDGELATAQGATAAKAVLVAAERSGTSLRESSAAAPDAWRQFYPRADFGGLVAGAQEAVAAGCPAICLTVGDTGRGHALRSGRNWSAGAPARYDWDQLVRLQESAGTRLVLKGIMEPDDAGMAAESGLAGIIASNHGTGRSAGTAEPVSMLPRIAEAVEGRIPILVDGGFRTGGDVIKAIALGATGVLLCRPVLWGLSAYGAAGVQKVVEMLQTEMAKDMVQIGAVNLAAIRRDHVRVHSR